MKINQKSKTINDNKENNSLSYIKFQLYDKYKDLLQNLLKNALEPALLTCEKNTANHLSSLKTSIELTKLTTDIVIKLESQINEKILKDTKKFPTIKNQKKNKSKPQTLRNKTPLKAVKSSKQIPFIDNSNKTLVNFHKKNMQINNDFSANGLVKHKTMKRINTVGNFSKNSLSNNQNIVYKKKKRQSISYLNNFKTNNQNNINDKTFTDININDSSLQRPSEISQKSNGSHKNNIINTKKILSNKNLRSEKNLTDLNKNKSRAKIIKNIQHRKPNFQNLRRDDNLAELFLTDNNNYINNINNISKRKKTPFQDRKKSIDNGNNYSKQTYNQKINIKKKAILNTLELKLQKEDLIDYLDNEPLLTNCDLIQGGVIRKNTVEFEEYLQNLNKLINDKNINFKNILSFLQLEDAITFKNVSKKFRRIFLEFILSNYEKEKNYLIKLKTNIENTNKVNLINKNINLEDFTLSKAAVYAINLLTEELLNKLFDNKLTPRDDVLLIYRIFFLIIDNPIKDIQYQNKNEFWGKCRDYFLKEAKGNIGDLLINIVKNKKICVKENILIKIWNLVKNKLDKIKPTHFEKICATTELFSFFICDVLDFIGISNDLNYQVNGYFIYLSIINDVNNKINILKKSK